MRVTFPNVLSYFLLATRINSTFGLLTSTAAIELEETTNSSKVQSTIQSILQSSSALVAFGSSTLGTAGLQAASACWSQWDAYSLHSSQCQLTTTSVLSNTFTEVETSIAYETYKLCDGHARARASAGERTSTVTITELFSVSRVTSSGSAFFSGESTRLSYETTTLPPSGIPVSTATSTITTIVKVPKTRCIITEPTPQCSIDSNNCRSLYQAWSAGDFKRNIPPCHYDPPKDPCVQCNIYIPSVKLMYFPVSMTGNFCGEYLTATPTSALNGNSPTTVEISGTTFTSGFAYFSYAGITPGNGGGICGSKKSAGILAVPSSEVSSYRGHVPAMQQAGDIKWSFNFADLAPNPVPWDAWINQETCAGHTQSPNCQIITQAAYRPALAYPRQLWALDPAWSNCEHFAFGIVDPPTALVVAGEVAGPTYGGTAPVTSSPALPQPSVSHELPTVTSTQPSQDPGSDGSSTVTSVTPVITIDPIATSFLPDITTISNTNDISAIDPTNIPSGSNFVPPTGSSSVIPVPTCAYTAILMLAVMLLALINT